MRWQLGGNLEPVRIICEADWKQCSRAILKYIWTEVVTDVVDCLITEETIWKIIAILVACMILLRILYVRRRCENKPIPSEDTLNRVGYKVEDLELKINILTYKLQYGTWPFPYQIRNPAIRKQLRNLRLTLSTSSDRNSWIKHMLLSTTPDTYNLSQPKFDSVSARHTSDEIFDTKTEYGTSKLHPDITQTDYSDIKSSKTTSAESLEKCHLECNNQRGLSKSENLGKLNRTGVQLSLLPQKDSMECLKWKKTEKQKRSKFSRSKSRLAPCERYTESLRECKRFLRELKESKKELELKCSSSSAISNNDSFMKETYSDEKSSLHAQTTDARNASRRCEFVGGIEKGPAKMEREKKNFKTIMKRETSHDGPPKRVYGTTSNNGSMSPLNLTDDDNLTRNFESLKNIVIPPGDNNVIQMSRETLYQIKQKLESLDNVLRAYGMLNSRTRGIEEAKRSSSSSNDIRAIYRNIIETLDNMKTIEIEGGRTNDSVDFDGKNYSNKIVQTTTNNEFEHSKSSDEESLIPVKKDPLTIEIKRKQEAVEDATAKIDVAFTQPPIPDHELVKNNSSYREVILTRREFEKRIEELSEFPIPMETDEDPSIASTPSSQPEISKSSDFESESTALLLREALECKKELLSRIKLHKFYSNVELGQNNNESYNDNFMSDNNAVYSDAKRIFPSNLLDIIAEERSISGCTDETSRTYIFLRTKESSEASDRSLSSVNIDLKGISSKQEDPKEESSRDVIPIASSRYFSLDRFTEDRPRATHDFRDLRNIIFEEETPSDERTTLAKNETIKDANSLRRKKRYKEVNATRGNITDHDKKENRKRLCHRRVVRRLYRARSVQESCREKRNGSIKKISNANKPLRNKNKIFFKDEEIFGETDDFSSISSVKSFGEHRYAIDNGSMTNFLSSTDSNVQMIKYPIRNDNDEAFRSHELALERCPGTFSFAHLKMNATAIPKDGDLFTRNPYFLAETTLSGTTCGLIPLSVSTAIIESREASLFTIARNEVLGNVADASSRLQICYKDDLENGNIMEIIENKFERNEMQIMRSIKNIGKDKVLNPRVEETTINQIEEGTERSEYVEVEPANLKFPNNHSDINNADSIENTDSTKSRCDMISQQSSSYFTGDTSSSTNELDTESLKKSNCTDILESCIDSCLNLLNSKVNTNRNDTPLLQRENKNSIEYADNNNKDASDKTSTSYVDANISQTFDDDTDRHDSSSIAKEAQRRIGGGGLFFDGSIRYKKPSASRSTIQKSVKGNLQISDINSIKTKPAKVDVKSKSTMSMERSMYSKKSTSSDSQLKAKSNLNIIANNNSKDLATDSIGSCARPSSCSLSRGRSRSYIISRRSESSSRSATISQSENQLENEKIFDEKSKSRSQCKQSLTNPKSFSKSCIPILKSRLDARRGDQTYRPNSPLRGPLTMTGLRRNKIDTNVQNINEVVKPEEDSSIREEKSAEQSVRNGKTTEEEKTSDGQFITESSKESSNVIGENCVPREQTVIYVNIVQQHNRNVTRILNPEKFLEYAKGESIALDESNTKLQSSMLPKIVAIVSSVSHEPDVNSKNDDSPSNLHISTGTLKSLWSVTIQQKEIEVTAKPSVTDTSTSISDLQKATESLHDHRIFGIPKELTNEEYSCMLQILTQKTNLAHLNEIRNLCNRLRPRKGNSN